MAQGNWMTAAVNLGLLLAVIGSVMFVADTGVTQSWEVISGDDGNVTNETYAALGQTVNATTAGDVDITDRIVVGAIAMTILTGIGAIGYSRKDPEAMRLIYQYYPLIGMAVGLTVFSTEVFDMLQGEYDFATHSDGQNAIHMAVTGWVLSGVGRLVNNR